jgi:hypothetical protein
MAEELNKTPALLPPEGPSINPLQVMEQNANQSERDAYTHFNPNLPRIPQKSLADFQRDLEQKNVLIKGRWGIRGTVSMHVSTTGTGKSILQTQSALCFNRGLPCCGLTPTRPFRTWIIQSEDDDDRVALDRDDIAAHLATIYPNEDWQAAIRETRFLDFTSLTGPKFIECLNNELLVVKKENPEKKPDAVIVNPLNASFGGDLTKGADASAFFKGGDMRNRETEGLESVLKRHGVWGWIFSHTGKPPTKQKDLEDWLNNPYAAYSMCGANEIADSVRSIMTFLKCPGHDGMFVFNACKNGNGLKWTDANGNHTTRAVYKWGDDGRHYWQDVPKDEQQTILASLGQSNSRINIKPHRPMPPPLESAIDTAVRAFQSFKTAIPRRVAELQVREAVNQERRQAEPPQKDLSRDDARDLLDLMKERGIIKILPKGSGGAKGTMCGLPPIIDKFLDMNKPMIDVPPTAPTSGPDTELDDLNEPSHDDDHARGANGISMNSKPGNDEPLDPSEYEF